MCLTQALLCPKVSADISCFIRLFSRDLFAGLRGTSPSGSKGFVACFYLHCELPAWGIVAGYASVVSVRRRAILLALAFRLRCPGTAASDVGRRRRDSACA